jgi:hypothetical protein
MAETRELTEEQRKALWEQFVTEHGKAQETFDSSLRTLAGAGLGITVSLATALKTMPSSGRWAAGLFLASLLVNLGSYVSAQLDMRTRMETLKKNVATYEGAEHSAWTTVTWVMNVAAGLALLAGGILLVIFISTTA